MAAFAEAARQYERERSDAVVQVDRILGETRREDVAALVERPELRTCGALQHLSELIETELAHDAPYAEVLAMLALAVATVLPPGYPRITVCQLRAQALRDLGEASSALGRYDEAIEAFTGAESELEAVGGLEHDRAIIRMGLALTWRKSGRGEAARALLSECERIFREFGDTARAEIARYHLVVLLQPMHEPRGARALLSTALLSSTGLLPEMVVDLCQRIALCSIDLGERELADLFISKAIGVYAVLEMPLEALRVEHACGRLLLDKGCMEEGLQHLQSARHKLLKHSMAEEAALCGLEIVEALLARGDSDGAHWLVRTIASELLAAGANARAIAATVALADTISGGKSRPIHARHVRDYIVSLRR